VAWGTKDLYLCQVLATARGNAKAIYTKLIKIQLGKKFLA